MIEKFIEAVETAEREQQPALTIDTATAAAVKDFIVIAQDARSRGGQIGGAKSKGGGRPCKYKNAGERRQARLEQRKNLN